MLAKIHVIQKNGVLDTQGKAVHHALNDLGYDEVKNVQIGKYMEIQLSGLSEEEAKVRVQEMCEKLLANTVIESYKFTLVPAGEQSPA
jgi:phosphoribosylformylglycinamidine synthase